MADYIADDIKQDIADAQAQIQKIVETLRGLDAQRAKIVPELNAHQGVLRFLLDKLPAEERESVLTTPQIEESADSDS
jgi:hypothetical protein|tara:strand:+ start:1330 stop:1563 length:234 start_codon:yes stop_codon:yes gene_type:complete